MANPIVTDEKTGKPETKQAGTETEHSLKGTFASVMILGAFIIVAWVLVFVLFMARN